MASNADLFLNIIAKDRASGVLSSIGGAFQTLGNQIGGELGNVVSSVGQGFDRLGEKGHSLGVKLAAIGGATAAVGFGLQALGSNEQAAQQQLQAAISATGNSWSDYQDKIQNAIKKGEQFAHSAADTENALQTLTSATNDPAKALKYLGTVFDLAAARHIDLSSAADLVARALNGNAKLLKAYGISMDGVGTKTDQAGRAVDKLGKKLSGQAAASVDTFTGHLDILKTEAGDIVSKFAGPVGTALSNFGSVVGGVGILLETGITKRFRTAIAGAEGFGGKLRALGKFAVPIAGIGAALSIVVAALDASAQAAGRAQAAADGFYGAWGQAGNSKQAIETVYNQLNSFPGLTDRLTNSFGDWFQSVEHSGDVLRDLGIPLTDIESHLRDNEDQWKTYRQKLLDASDAAGKNGATTNLLARNLDELRTGAVNANNKLADTATTNDIFGSSATSVTIKVRDEAKAFQELTDNVTSFNDRFSGAQSAQIQVRDSMRSLIDSLKQGKGQFAGTSAAADDAKSKAIAFADAVDKEAQNMRDLHKPSSDVISLYKRQHDALQQTLIKMGVSKTVAKQYADQLLKIPSKVKTALETDVSVKIVGITLAASAARAVIAAAHVKSSSYKDFGPHAAAGAIVQPLPGGTQVTIGEAGKAEAIIPLSNRGSSRVHGSGDTYYVTINTKADPQDVVRAVQKFSRANGRSWLP